MTEQTFTDITAPEIVEIQIRSDGKVVWVNVDGICRLRACQVKHVVFNDERVHSEEVDSQLAK